MALPFLLLALATGAFGAKRFTQARRDQELATALNLEASAIVGDAQRWLKGARSGAEASLELVGQLKLELAGRQLGRFIHLAQRVRRVEAPDFSTWAREALPATPDELVEIQDVAIHASLLLQGGAQALGGGAL